MNYKTLFSAIIINVFLINSTIGQSLQIIQKSLDEARDGKYTAIDFREFSNHTDITKSISLLASFQNDSVESVRNRVYMILGRMEPYVKQVSNREKSVELLSKGINDQSSGIVGNVLEYLKDFKADDFNEAAKQNVSFALRNGSAHYPELIKIAGFVNMENLGEHLNRIATADSLSGEIKWSVKLAQARIGDIDAVNFIMTKVRRYTVNDNYMYQILPTVLYIKNLRVARLLSNIILDDAKNCQSADMEQDDAIICGFQAMEYLANMVENFPIPVDSDGYLETDDYTKALQTTRDWLATDPQFVFDKTKY